MVVPEILTASEDLISKIGNMVIYLQTIGIIILIWTVIQVAAYILERKKLKILKKSQADIKRIEKKLDSLILLIAGRKSFSRMISALT